MSRSQVKAKYVKALAWYFDESMEIASKDLGHMLDLGGDNLLALKEIAHIYETQSTTRI